MKIDLMSILNAPHLQSRPYIYTGAGTIVNGQTGFITIQVDKDACFIVEKMSAISSVTEANGDKWLIRVTDTTTGWKWSNLPVTLRDIFGRGYTPNILLNPRLLEPNTSVTFECTNNHSASQNLYITLEGRKISNLSESEKQMLKKNQWFQYVASVTLGVSARTNFAFAIEDISDFICKKLISHDTNLATNIILLNAKNSSNDQALTNGQTPTLNMFGTYNSNYGANVLRKPIFMPRNSSFQLDLQDITGNGFTGRYVFEGVRLI